MDNSCCDGDWKEIIEQVLYSNRSFQSLLNCYGSLFLVYNELKTHFKNPLIYVVLDPNCKLKYFHSAGAWMGKLVEAESEQSYSHMADDINEENNSEFVSFTFVTVVLLC